MVAADPMALRMEAQRLAELWSRVASLHVGGGQACACSVGGVLLSAADFELDIVEFVVYEARKIGAVETVDFIESVARRGPEAYSLSALLEAMGDGRADPPLGVSGLDFIVSRLRRTLGSLDDTHRDTRPPPVIGRRF